MMWIVIYLIGFIVMFFATMTLDRDDPWYNVAIGIFWPGFLLIGLFRKIMKD
jgi:hypothetical protein